MHSSTPTEPSGAVTSPPTGREVLRGLGIEPLVEFLEGVAYGVCITGENHTWVYVNPAGERIIGERFEELRGRDYTLHFPQHEREVLLRLEQDQRAGDTDFYTNTVIQPDGSEVEMTWSGTVIEAYGVELAPAIFHATTPVRRGQRAAAQVAAQMAGQVTGHAAGHMAGHVAGHAAGHATGHAAGHAAGVGRRVDDGLEASAPSDGRRSTVVDSLVHEVIRESRASSAVLLLEDSDGDLQVASAAGADPALAAEVDAARPLLSALPGTEDLARGRSVFLSDARTQLEGSTRPASWRPLLADSSWTGAVLIGVRCDDRLAGCLLVLLPESLTSPSESEVAFWSSLADQMGVTLGAERIRATVWRRSALTERHRIARDLHDSVSQALFSLHARAQVVRRALSVGDEALAREAAGDLELLSRQATSELRQLVSQLRPDDETEADLTPALRTVADETSRLDDLPVEVSFSPATLPLVPPTLGEHIPRIVREALHNTVKHAGASSAAVRVTATEGWLHVEVEDDGRGFDPASRGGDGFGQQTMRERARLCGGELSVGSAPGAGTTVSLRVPLA